jgi:hypothetical protein
VGGQVADRPGDAPPAESAEPAVLVGGDVPLNGRPAEPGNGGGLLPGQAVVEERQDEHLAADVSVGV